MNNEILKVRLELLERFKFILASRKFIIISPRSIYSYIYILS